MDEKWIADLYKRQKNTALKGILICIASICIMTGITMLVSSQFIKDLVFIIYCIFLIVSLMKITFYDLLKITIEIDTILTHQCDSKKYLELTGKIVSYGKQLTLKRGQKTLLYIMEQKYVTALIAAKKVEKAKEYLEYEWSGKKNTKIYKMLQINCQFVEAFQEKKVEDFPDEKQKEYKKFKNNLLFAAQKMIASGEYQSALIRLSDYKAPSNYYAVIRKNLLGICYDNLERQEEAKECMEFVAQNGNTLPCRQSAINWLKEHGIEIPQQGESDERSRIRIVCDKQYYKKVRKQNKTALFLISLCSIAGSFLFLFASVATAFFLTQFFSKVNVIGAAAECMVLVILFILILDFLRYRHMRKKNEGREIEIVFHEDYFTVTDNKGMDDRGSKVIKTGNGYKIKPDTSKKTIYLLKGSFDYEQNTWMEYHLEKSVLYKVFHAIKNIVIVIGMLLLMIQASLTLINYNLNYAEKTIDQSVSENKEYKLVLKSVGNPFLFGSANGKIILKEKNHTIEEFPIVISNDGGRISKKSWTVVWEMDFVTITLRGDEQPDEILKIDFDGNIIEKKTKEPDIEEIPEEQSTAKPLEELEEQEETNEYSKEMEGYKAVYQKYFENKNKSFIEDYDAKGHSRVILFENLSTIEYLVYDRDSNNGNCGIYVYYKCEKKEDGSWSPMDAQILDFFAYEYSSKEVIRGEKHGWAEQGSSQYQKITGEP